MDSGHTPRNKTASSCFAPLCHARCNANECSMWYGIMMIHVRKMDNFVMHSTLFRFFLPFPLPLTILPWARGNFHTFSEEGGKMLRTLTVEKVGRSNQRSDGAGTET